MKNKIEKMIEAICEDKEKFGEVLDWLARMVQFPGEKRVGERALVISAPSGAGKSVLARVFRRIGGGDFAATIVCGEKTRYKFNEYLEGKTLVIFDEVTEPKDWIRLKSIVASSEIQINRMYVYPRQIPNRARYIIMTQSALQIDENRRYLIVNGRVPNGGFDISDTDICEFYLILMRRQVS